MSIQKVSKTMIYNLSASKLTGALPALDGSALTNVASAVKSAVDPAIDSNKSLGTIWVNTTSGEVYSCTDATTDANVWTNVGGLSGNIEAQPFGGLGGGSNYGYTMGGYISLNTGYTDYSHIEKWSYTSDGNSANCGNLLEGLGAGACHSSATHGYFSGGYKQAYIDTIQKFQFSADGNTADTGANLTSSKAWHVGNHSSTHGYCMSGGQMNGQVIEKFSTTSDDNSTNVGNVSSIRYHSGGPGCSSYTHAYCIGGVNSSWSPFNSIEKVAFASDGHSTDVGDLTVGKDGSVGASSKTHGYAQGGNTSTNICKFSFSSDANATVSGQAVSGSGAAGAGGSSTTHGYKCGAGYNNSGELIDKFSFASEGDSVKIGDKVNDNYSSCAGGAQY